MKDIIYQSRSQRLHALLSSLIELDPTYSDIIQIKKTSVSLSFFDFLTEAKQQLKSLPTDMVFYDTLSQAYLYVYHDKRMQHLTGEDYRRYRALQWVPKTPLEESADHGLTLSTEPSLALSQWLIQTYPKLVSLAKQANSVIQTSSQWPFTLANAKRFNLYSVFLVHLSLLTQENLKSYLDCFKEGVGLVIDDKSLFVTETEGVWTLELHYLGLKRQVTLTEETLFHPFKVILTEGRDLLLAIEEMHSLSGLASLFE